MTGFVPNVTPLSELNRCYLEGEEMDAYDAISSALKANQTEVSIPCMGLESLTRVYRAIISDCHDAFKLYRDDPLTVCGETATLRYAYGASEAKDVAILLENKIGQIIDRCRERCNTHFQYEEYIHDYLADTVTYVKSHHRDDKTEHTAAGALLEGRAVCEGIAKATSLLLQRLGADIGCIVSNNHMWNIIRLDGEYYNLDVTWDLDGEFRRHKYFNVTDREVMADHSVDYGPACNGIRYNWYRYKGILFNNYEDIDRYVSNVVKEKATVSDFRYQWLEKDLVVNCVCNTLAKCGGDDIYDVWSHGEDIIQLVRINNG